MPNNSWLIKALTLAANVLRNNAVAITSVRGAGGYPPQIPAGMRVDPATVTDDYGRITVSTSNKGNESKERNADITIAFELGSGIWSQYGARKKYPITPTNAEYLAFNWPASLEAATFTRPGKQDVVPSPNGDVVLPRVMHPGIRPRPFLQKGLAASEGELDAIILGEFEGYLVEILP